MTFREFNIAMGALCTWREARGEGVDGMRAVLHVINNRSHFRSKTWAFIVDEKLQFSSMTYGKDPELCLVPEPEDKSFGSALVLAQAVYDSYDEDITLGADHYFNPGVVMPTWAKDMKFLIKIGHHDFYRGQ